MANGVVVEEGRNSSEETETVTATGTAMALFTEEELREMSGVKNGGDYIEVTCGCTNHRYGDAVGRLRVFLDGHLEIICECTPGCDEVLRLLPGQDFTHFGGTAAITSVSGSSPPTSWDASLSADEVLLAFDLVDQPLPIDGNVLSLRGSATLCTFVSHELCLCTLPIYGNVLSLRGSVTLCTFVSHEFVSVHCPFPRSCCPFKD
ncbi:Protein ULTRAPETALA 1 [Linum perenne]